MACSIVDETGTRACCFLVVSKLREGSWTQSGESAPASAPRSSLGSLWLDLRGIVRDAFLLAALEARRSGRAFVHMVAYGIIAAILLVTAWLALVGAAVLAATNAGAASLPGALVIAALLNIAAAIVLVWMIKRWDAQLLFVATLRRLRDPDMPEDG
mgnify:CR=1 FL=1